jgi:hypothetical protein
MSKKSKTQAVEVQADPAVAQADVHVIPNKPLSKAARQYHERRVACVCVKCGGALAPESKLLCPGHLAYYNEWHAAKRSKVDEMAARIAELEAKLAKKTK